MLKVIMNTHINTHKGNRRDSKEEKFDFLFFRVQNLAKILISLKFAKMRGFSI